MARTKNVNMVTNSPNKNRNQQQTLQIRLVKQRRSKRKGTSRKLRRRNMLRAVPAAFGARTRTFQSTKSMGSMKTSMRFSEEWVITPQQSGNSFTLMIPACPTKWTNHRASVLAATYGSYRPLNVRYAYIPSVGSNTLGTVTIGTIWNGNRAPSGDFANVSPILAATPGGMTTNVWGRFSRIIPQGTNLQQNNYPTSNVEADDIPWWILVSTSIGNESALTEIGRLRLTVTYAFYQPTMLTETPVSATGTMSITHNNETNTTIGTVANAVRSGVFSIGKEYLINFARALTNTNDRTIVNPLSPLVAEFTGFDNDNMTFNLDNHIGTQSLPSLFSIVGVSPINFS